MSLTTKQRQDLYDREQKKARDAGRGEFPICNLDFCGLPIFPGQPWDESHVGTPKALGGIVTGCAHRKCNRVHGNQVVTPMVAKMKRMRAKFTGAKIESHRPLPCGRNSPFKKKIGSSRPVWRDSGRPVG